MDDRRSRSIAAIGPAALIAVLMMALAREGVADELRATPRDYIDRIAQLQPGDTLRLAPGVYERGLPVVRRAGTPAAPIRIVAEDPGSRPRFLAQRSRNTISIVDSEYVEIQGLDLDGGGLEVDAVKAEGHAQYAHHITLSDLRISNFSRDQQTVGISTKCPAWGWRIVGNEIRGIGTGIYLGSSDGSAPFIGGVIERNLIVDTTGYNMQIKHQIARPSLAGLPTSPQRTVIRDNVLAKGELSARGEFARPNLLVGHFPIGSVGSDDEYAIHGNFIYANPSEALLQAEGNVAIYSNVFVNPRGDAIAIQPHHDRPRRVRVFGNTVMASGTGIRITGLEPDARAIVAGNLVFDASAVAWRDERGNVTDTFENAGRRLRRPHSPPGEGLDVRPLRRLARYDQTPFTDLPDSAATFDGTVRRNGDAGAYEVAVSGPSWPLALEPKPRRRRE